MQTLRNKTDERTTGTAWYGGKYARSSSSCTRSSFSFCIFFVSARLDLRGDSINDRNLLAASQGALMDTAV